MAEDEELEKIRRRKLLELQQRLAREQETELRRRLEIQKQSMLTETLIPEKGPRLTNQKMVRPESVSQLEPQLIPEEKESEEKGYATERSEGKEASGEIDVFQISDHLRAKVEEARAGANIEATSILPKLNERKERLEEDIHQDQEKIAEIEDLIPKLKQKKKDLQEGMKRKQEETSKIDEIKLILQKF